MRVNAAQFRSDARRAAADAIAPSDEGAHGEARRLIAEHCQKYEGLEQAGIAHTDTRGKSPAELADLIGRG